MRVSRRGKLLGQLREEGGNNCKDRGGGQLLSDKGRVPNIGGDGKRPYFSPFILEPFPKKKNTVFSTELLYLIKLFYCSVSNHIRLESIVKRPPTVPNKDEGSPLKL